MSRNYMSADNGTSPARFRPEGHVANREEPGNAGKCDKMRYRMPPRPHSSSLAQRPIAEPLLLWYARPPGDNRMQKEESQLKDMDGASASRRSQHLGVWSFASTATNAPSVCDSGGMSWRDSARRNSG